MDITYGGDALPAFCCSDSANRRFSASCGASPCFGSPLRDNPGLFGPGNFWVSSGVVILCGFASLGIRIVRQVRGKRIGVL